MENTYNSFICVGDTHGNFKLISHRIKSLKLTDMTIFHVGDFGVGFNLEYEISELSKLDDILQKVNCKLYVIRGNHDDPYYFDGKWSDQFKNIFLVKDYTVVEVNGENVLMVGGAISIDRRQRNESRLEYARYNISKITYWPNEHFNLDIEKLKELKNIDYVITHSCPDFCAPVNCTSNVRGSHGHIVEQFAELDDKLKDDLNLERINHTKMYDILIENNKIKKWLYGHFHQKHSEVINNTEFIILDIGQFLEVRQ